MAYPTIELLVAEQTMLKSSWLPEPPSTVDVVGQFRFVTAKLEVMLPAGPFADRQVPATGVSEPQSAGEYFHLRPGLLSIPETVSVASRCLYRL